MIITYPDTASLEHTSDIVREVAKVGDRVEIELILDRRREMEKQETRGGGER